MWSARDLEVLGLPAASAEDRRLLALDDLWMTFRTESHYLAWREHLDRQDYILS